MGYNSSFTGAQVQAVITKKHLDENYGGTVIVTGPKVTGSSPPEKGPTTIARIAHFTALGYSTDQILWSVVGEE
jgi:hypothetical protein